MILELEKPRSNAKPQETINPLIRVFELSQEGYVSQEELSDVNPLLRRAHELSLDGYLSEGEVKDALRSTPQPTNTGTKEKNPTISIRESPGPEPEVRFQNQGISYFPGALRAAAPIDSAGFTKVIHPTHGFRDEKRLSVDITASIRPPQNEEEKAQLRERLEAYTTTPKPRMFTLLELYMVAGGKGFSTPVAFANKVDDIAYRLKFGTSYRYTRSQFIQLGLEIGFIPSQVEMLKRTSDAKPERTVRPRARRQAPPRVESPRLKSIEPKVENQYERWVREHPNEMYGLTDLYRMLGNGGEPDADFERKATLGGKLMGIGIGTLPKIPGPALIQLARVIDRIMGRIEPENHQDKPLENVDLDVIFLSPHPLFIQFVPKEQAEPQTKKGGETPKPIEKSIIFKLIDRGELEKDREKLVAERANNGFVWPNERRKMQKNIKHEEEPILSEKAALETEKSVGLYLSEIILTSIANSVYLKGYETSFQKDPVKILEEASAPDEYLELVKDRELAVHIIAQLLVRTVEKIWNNPLPYFNGRVRFANLARNVVTIREGEVSLSGIIYHLYRNFGVKTPDYYSTPSGKNDAILTMSANKNRRRTPSHGKIRLS